MSLLFLLFLIPITIFAIWDTTTDTKPVSFKNRILGIVIWIIILVSTIFSYYAYLLITWYGVLHYSVIFVFSLICLITDIKIRSNTDSRPLTVATGIILILVIFMFIIVIPKAVIPNISISQEPTITTFSQEINPKPILDNLNIIKESIEDTKDKLSIEIEGINNLTSVLVSEIEKKNNDLIQIENERNRALEELEYYKSLASVNKEQADAILKTINKPRYLDYIIGLVIGIITSGAFFLIQNFYLKKRKPTTLSTKEKKSKITGI